MRGVELPLTALRQGEVYFSYFSRVDPFPVSSLSSHVTSHCLHCTWALQTSEVLVIAHRPDMLTRWRAGVRLSKSVAARFSQSRVYGGASSSHLPRAAFYERSETRFAECRRLLSSPSKDSASDNDSRAEREPPNVDKAGAKESPQPEGRGITPSTADTSLDDGNPGAIGGFMRGLMGGRDVAAEDAFVAEAKEQGIDLPPPPPQHRADLVPIKRRKRREDDDAEDQSIRDRLFSRFAGSPFMQGAFDAKERIAERIDESDNPVVNFFRNIYDRIFAENEMAMVVREIREDDKAFTVSDFLRDAEESIIPKILGAYLAGERDVLKELCTEDAYRMLNASIREREAEGIIMDTNILDISEVELTAGRLLEESPVLIVTFSAQQINCLRNKSGAVIEGSVDDIRAVYYVWAFVRELDVEVGVPTGGGMGASADPASDDSEKENDGSSVSAESDKNTSEESAESDGDDSAKTGKETGERTLPPWKMMEMVVRGAHSTI